jgi:hypothetical protein
MKKTILSVMKKVMLLALLLTMGNIYSYSSPVQVSMNIRAQKGQALLRPFTAILTIENYLQIQ